jgi:hypothetical protein
MYSFFNLSFSFLCSYYYYYYYYYVIFLLPYIYYAIYSALIYNNISREGSSSVWEETRVAKGIIIYREEYVGIQWNSLAWRSAVDFVVFRLM